MPLIETEGLVIKSYSLAEADRIVVFLTRDQGVIRGVAKGAKRLKSKFGSGLEPFSVVRLSYFQKEAVELVSIQKAELSRSYFETASDPDLLQKFAYFADLLAEFSPPHDPNETLYRMACACLEAAALSPERLSSIAVYFELWLLRLSGYLPDWTRCEKCKRALEEVETVEIMSNGTIVCGVCRRSASGPSDAVQRQLYRSALRLSPSDFALSAIEQHGAVEDLSANLRRIIARSIGKPSVVDVNARA